MVFFRNVQFRWMPLKGESRITFAVERPGGSADQGRYANGSNSRMSGHIFRLPDFSGEARLGRKWGYIRSAGIYGEFNGWTSVPISLTSRATLGDGALI